MLGKGSMLDKIVTRYIHWLVKHPLLVLLGIVLVTAGLALGLPNFKIDASADSLTLQHDSDLDYFREVNKRYQSGDFLVVTYKPHQDLFSDEALTTLRSLRDELKQVSGVSSVMSMLDVPLLYSPKVALTDLAATPRILDQPDTNRELAKQEFLHSPIYRDMLLGPDGQTTALLVNLNVDNRYIALVRERDSLRLKASAGHISDAEKQQLATVSKTFLDYRTQADMRAHARVDEVRGIVANYKDRADLFVGGASMITSDMVDFIRSDLVVFGSAILLLIILIMAVIFREWRFVFLPLLTCVVSVVMMLGFVSWIDWRLTVISSNFVALLLIINLAITIHLAVRYREFHAQNPDWERAQLVIATVENMARPCLYTILTTMVAFASLVVSDIKPVIDFGWMMTIGLGLALILSFVLLPAALMLWPQGEPRDKGDNSAVLTLRFSRFTEKHGRVVMGVSLLAALLSIWGMSRLEVENRFIDYFHKSTEIYQGMSVIDKYLGGTIGLDIIISDPVVASSAATDLADDPFADPVDAPAYPDSDDPFASDDTDPYAESDSFAGNDPFAETDSDAEADPFADSDPFADDALPAESTDSQAAAGADKQAARKGYWFTLNGLQQIEQVHDYLEALPEVGKVQSLATLYKVAKDINGTELNDFELALLKKSVPDQINSVLVDPYLSAGQTRISLRVKETDPNLHRMELVEKIRHFLITDAGFSPDQVRFSGLLVLYNNMLQSLFSSQIITLGAVFLGIMLMFVALFRSLTLSVVAILPNLLAAGVVLGGMGLAGVPLDMMTITIAAITVGIGVDDTIHYIHRFQAEFPQDRNYLAAMHRSHASIGRAMFYTSVTIISGFSILALSRFIPSVYFGLLTAFAMFAAIVAALTLLPQLIVLFKPFGKEGLPGAPIAKPITEK